MSCFGPIMVVSVATCVIDQLMNMAWLHCHASPCSSASVCQVADADLL